MDSTVARAVVTGSSDPRPFRVSPDGKYVLHGANLPDASHRSLVRVSFDGGPAQVVAKMDSWTGFDCPSVPAVPCVSSEARTGQLVFSTFDPLTGSGREIASVDARDPESRQWDLSPDASRIVVSDIEEGHVTTLRLSDGQQRTLATEKMIQGGASWASSSDALLVYGYGEHRVLLRMDLEGKTRTLLETDLEYLVDFTPSPDGRRLAYVNGNLNSNIWLLENF